MKPKRRNWRHTIPDAPDRKRIRAKRARLKPFGLTYIIALQKRVSACLGSTDMEQTK